MSTPRNAGVALTSRRQRRLMIAERSNRLVRYDPSVVAAILAETDKHLSSIGRSREYICGLRSASPPPPRSLPWLSTVDHHNNAAFRDGQHMEEEAKYTYSAILEFIEFITLNRMIAALHNRFDVTTALLKQQEALDGLAFTTENIKSVQNALHEDITRELQAWQATADQKIAENLTLCRNEMAAIREETRKLAHSLAGISGIKSDAESVANLQTMVQDLRRKSEEVSSEMRNTKLKLRETNTTEETSRLVMEATRSIEDTLTSRLGEKEREIAESTKEWQGKFETSQRLQFGNLENRLNEISSELARCRSDTDSSVKRVATQLEHHNEDMAEVTSRIDTLASAQSALSGKVETVDDKRRINRDGYPTQLRPLNAGRIEGSIQEESAMHVSKIDGEIDPNKNLNYRAAGETNRAVDGRAESSNHDSSSDNTKARREPPRIYSMLREFVETERYDTRPLTEGQGVPPIDYERMIEDFYAHIEELRRSVARLGNEDARYSKLNLSQASLSERLEDLYQRITKLEDNAGWSIGDVSASAIVDRIQVIEADGHRVQAKISEEDERIGIKILLSEAESSEKISAIEGEVGNIRSILNEHDERLSEVEYRIAEREGRQDHSPGDFTKNQAEHFIERLSQSVAEEVREGRLRRDDFEELSGLTSPVIHNQQVCDRPGLKLKS
ncbi:hypothetical protein FOZ60_011347 [Perkinsus olseni]|uniref:Uncharacterized protein n=1 Tax=Perkinsus olseni TaxID=32597 RepID=A0A7J6NFX9_PEROL|nr:hypothetical protein FOZ60_011347 [Perkinsus olseni]